MHKIFLWLASASLLAVTAEAKAAQYEVTEPRAGAFVGARFKMSLGGRAGSQPHASLAIAPTFRRSSNNGEIRSVIGDGAAINLRPDLTLTLAGVRADKLLELQPQKDVEIDRQQGVSKGGWIAIGVGTALVAAAIVGYTIYDTARDNSD